ncbi:MAG TPA: hypothetical protein VHR86_04680, partial [Armatimonadota bacterium]|nr:hypothetical protein [Armatimonadota bacterium]
MYTPPFTGAAAGIEAVLFDLDGTLVLTHIDFSAMRTALTAVAVEAGVMPADVAGLDLLAIVNRAMTHARTLTGDAAAAAIALRAEEVMTAVELQGLEGANPAPHVRE